MKFHFQVTIGCCTIDILKHLSGEEMSRHPLDGKPNDRLSRLTSHILSQRDSFYPLYPPAERVPMDFSLAPEALHISPVPDLLILPSDINPGRLAKGEGGGMFVKLKYQGSPDKMNASVINTDGGSGDTGNTLALTENNVTGFYKAPGSMGYRRGV
ncbi:hypothetical protein F3Y22_tig00111277pilonHSYRG00081 [Hibiscus syriacus]|uniref:DNA polymerase alpha subunit B n=1 Tax=Hibiscus syriacus TaxID=106335 RepID=A0A6A2YRM1_HIBSY|nr:hypothetical protein F3Y22_tig00111277pilonHSYRG00081 [Hibiscus syriacus]